MNDGDHLLVHDGTLAVLGSGGEITGRAGASPDGLFLHDGRHLSRWQLTFDGAAPDVLVPAGGEGMSTTVLTPPFGRDLPPACTVYRQQAVSEGALTERLRLAGNVGRPVTVRVTLTADADFADLFELRGDHTFDKPGGTRSAEQHADGVEFGYRRGDWQAATTVSAAPAPDAVSPSHDGAQRLEWTVTVPPHGSVDLALRVTAHPHGAPPARRSGNGEATGPAARTSPAPGSGGPPSTRGTVPGTPGDGRAVADGGLRGMPDAAPEAAETQTPPRRARGSASRTTDAPGSGGPPSTRGTVPGTPGTSALPHDAGEGDRQAAAQHGMGAGDAGTPEAIAARLAAETGAYVAAEPTPGTRTDWPELERACEQGLADLAGLRVPATGPDGEALRVPAAGVPWFLTLFGRDSLLTSLFALPYRPDLAAATLAALAATQAADGDSARVAEPGKIVHEVRHGELAHFGQVPFGRYYGTVDATPLFLVLLGAYTEQTGDPALARRLEKNARAAVDWMFRHGGLDEHGYLVYHADEHGLANQNWKDSPGAICSVDGTQAEGALAVSEVQGYAYDALRRTAALARTAWADTAYADRADTAAAGLKSRFRRDFWLPKADFPALALDGRGRQADALASDAGHLLWSGILDDRDATAVGRRLLEPDFFSGWGVRTLAAGQPAYHPLTYHRGSVWPHDNAVIALGLARYGLLAEARTVADGILALAAHTGWRLPEVLAGHGRDEHPAPVPYPHSCSPQAWAAATPLALLTAVGDTAPGT